MPKCPQCQVEVAVQAKFCSSCGAKMPLTAPKPASPPPKKSTTPSPTPAKTQSTPKANGPQPPKTMVLFYVISFFVGLFGIICGIIYLFKPNKECKKFGRNCLLWGLIPSLIMIIILSVIGMVLFTKAANDSSDWWNRIFNIFYPNNLDDNSNFNSNENNNINTNTNVNANLNRNTNINANLNSNINTNTNANLNTNLNINGRPTLEQVNPIQPDKTNTTTAASSTLLDSTNIGFDYSSATVLDQDFSTAWTENVADFGLGEWIRLDFPSTARINTVGIVPGYGRDEDIYFKNNRLKKIEITFSDGSKIIRELPDKYEMHFIEFPTVSTDSLKITVVSVFDGTTYDDTCIAEIDIWSDYVLNKDKKAAYNYYLIYKEPYALRPPSKTSGLYIDNTYMAIGIMGSPTPEIPVSSFTPDMEPMVAAVEIPLKTPQGKTFTCKWYIGTSLFYTEDITSYEPGGTEVITIWSTAYVSDMTSPTPPGNTWPLGDYKVVWYEDGKYSRTEYFSVTAQ